MLLLDCRFPSNSHAYHKTTLMLIILVHLYAFLVDKEIRLIENLANKALKQAQDTYFICLEPVVVTKLKLFLP